MRFRVSCDNRYTIGPSLKSLTGNTIDKRLCLKNDGETKNKFLLTIKSHTLFKHLEVDFTGLGILKFYRKNSDFIDYKELLRNKSNFQRF